MPNVRSTASLTLLRALAASALFVAAGAPHAQALPPGVRLGMTVDELQAALPAAERVQRPQRLGGGLLGSWRGEPVQMAGLLFEPTFFFAASELRRVESRVLVRLRAAEQGLGADDPQREAVATAIRELEELAVVFEKLLQIAEVEAGARRQQFAQVALHVIADDVAELYEAVAEMRDITLLRDPADMAFALGDRDLLAGAAANLLDNALKYAGDGATVRIGTHTVDGRAQLFVQDNGPGVPPAEFERIGVRFHRLDRSTPGHGLGLASVQAVVALHGGRLQLGDAAPGLRVCIDLPVAGD